MAPFSQAIQSSLVRTDQDGTAVYTGEVDPEWMINAVPHGGYVLALLTHACVQYQKSGPHCDPLHVTAHYLKASSKGSFAVRIRRLKAGRGYSNLTAELIQNDTVRVMTHWIFGTILPPSASTAHQQGDIHIPPSTSFYPRHPLSCLPKDLPRKEPRPVERFAHHVRRAHEPSRQEGSSVGAFIKDAGFVSGGWFEFADDKEELSWAALSFFADMNMATPIFLPEGQRLTPGKSWFPTLTLSVQFLAPLPRVSDGFASRTIGLHQSGRFVSRPDSRHEEQVEIWTAPDNFAGDFGAREGWRDRQVCLCIASQMGLVVSGAINEKLGARL